VLPVQDGLILMFGMAEPVALTVPPPAWAVLTAAALAGAAEAA
jgi:hypothetical protein